MSAVITPFKGTELFNTASFNNRISQINTGFSYISNPNLLDNWYFGRPVNQRGKTEYTGNSYYIDRWRSWDGDSSSLSVVSGGIKIAGTLYQYLEPVVFEELWGKTVAISLLLADGTLYTDSFVLKKADWYSVHINAHGLNSIQLGISNDDFENRNNNFFRVRPATVGTLSDTILAAKLELGSTQTLAHREGDKWVLNEIPDYGEQLRRCQRYYRRWTGADNKPLGVAVRRESKVLELVFSLDTAMRVAPSLTFNGSFVCVPTFTWCSVTSIDVATPDTVSIFLKPNDDVTFGLDAYQINIANANEYIALSADL